jgi:hypothetical protein
MNYQVLKLNAKERALEKQASRDRDSERLRQGRISAADLQRENSFFASFDAASFEIVSIGSRSIDRHR